jgi:hypothetical protein
MRQKQHSTSRYTAILVEMGTLQLQFQGHRSTMGHHMLLSSLGHSFLKKVNSQEQILNTCCIHSWPVLRKLSRFAPSPQWEGSGGQLACLLQNFREVAQQHANESRPQPRPQDQALPRLVYFSAHDSSCQWYLPNQPNQAPLHTRVLPHPILGPKFLSPLPDSRSTSAALMLGYECHTSPTNSP